MTKKRQETTDSDATQRQSRKEILIARKQERNLRAVRIGLAIVLGLIAIVALIAVINETVIAPQRTVITVGSAEVTMREWQDRVRYERAQRVIFLDNQLESFGGDVGIVQQFGGQVINDLLNADALGQGTLDAMADDAVICAAVEERGIAISDADVDARIGENFNYFGGLSPTALPEPTQTVEPTPSLTPIPADEADDPEPTEEPQPTSTAGPTATPPPTATPVSETAFQEEFGGIITSFEDLGVDEATYRSVVRAQLCREKFAEALAAEQNLATTGLHTNLFLLAFDSEEEALAAAEAANTSDAFLTEWNTIRSRPVSESEEEAPTSAALELLWRSEPSLEGSIGAEAAAQIAGLDINQPSGVITIPNGDGTSSYYVVMVSGREERELAEAELDTLRQELVQAYVDEAVVGNLVIDESWRSRVPIAPLLDPKFLVQPTVAPTATAGAVETAPTTPESGE